jgi:hypothetical protein
VRVVNFESMASASWDANWLRIGSRDGRVFAFESEDVAAIYALGIQSHRCRVGIKGKMNVPFPNMEVLVLIPMP